MSQKLIEDYIEYLVKEKKLSKNTLSAYKRDLKSFEDYLLINKIETLQKTNKTIIITYLMNLQKKGRATSTISRNLASLRSFFQYLLNNNKISEDPTLNLKAPKIERKIPDILTIGEIDILLDQPQANNLKGTRDKAMLELLYATGIKVSEIISLNMEDLDLDIGIISVGKNKDIMRIIPLGGKSIEALLSYINEYRKEEIESYKEPLFVNLKGNSLTRQGFWKILREYANKTNINKKITPDTIRHSFAVHLLENGADLKTVQEILGHSELSTTQIYEFVSKDKNLRDVYKKSHPRA